MVVWLSQSLTLSRISYEEHLSTMKNNDKNHNAFQFNGAIGSERWPWENGQRGDTEEWSAFQLLTNDLSLVTLISFFLHFFCCNMRLSVILSSLKNLYPHHAKLAPTIRSLSAM